MKWNYNVNHKIVLFFLLFSLFVTKVRSQCADCTSNITTNTAANITVSAGQTVCINVGVTCSGTVFLNGGTICNSGIITKLRLGGGRGIIHNYGNISDKETSIAFNGNVFIHSYPMSQISFTNVAISMNTADSLFFNSYNDSKVIFSNNLAVTSKKLVINNGLIYSGDPTNMHKSTFTTGGNLTITGADLCVNNTITGELSIGALLNLTNTGNKSITNDGLITTTGSFKISGDGGSSSVVKIKNKGTISIGTNFESSLSSGTVTLNNDFSGAIDPGFSVSGNVILSSANGTVTNDNGATIAGDLLISAGSIINTRTLTVNGKIENSGGTINNNYITYANNFINNAGTSNNVGFLYVTTSFTNTGTGVFKLYEKSTLRTYNYYNTVEASIQGPTLTVAEEQANKYGRIIIEGFSKNETVINGYIQVYDRSLDCSTSMDGYGFDVIANPSSIGSNVSFAAICIGTSPGILCTSPMIDLSINDPGIAICPEDSVVKLGAKFGWYLCLFPVEVQFNPITSGVTYTWLPGNINTMNINVSPTVTTVYTLTVKYQNCTYTKTVTVEVREDCPEEIIGCCFSNYGAAVWVNSSNTYLNIYCNLINELGYTSGVERGEFESRSGNIRVKLFWIHNAKNTLYMPNSSFLVTPADLSPYFGPYIGTTTFFGADQKIKGNSITYFNNMALEGNGRKSLWINEISVGSLNLNGNILDIRNHLFSMKQVTASVNRSSGYATTWLNGYFSRKLENATIIPTQAYLFPLGSSATQNSIFRYRPLVLANNSTSQADEVSANFMNMQPSIANDPVFVNSNTLVTNVTTFQSPSVLQINNAFYHKIKNTTPPTASSNLNLKVYYSSSDGYYQSLSEWEKDPNQQADWWGTTPGSSASTLTSGNPGTAGLIYAQANGTLNFGHTPFVLAKGGFYINTSSFGPGTGASPGTIITVTATNLGGSTPSGGGLGSPYGTGTNSGNTGSGGNTVFTPNPVAGTYVMNITPPNTCAISGKIKFVIDQNGNIDPNLVEYGIAGGTNYLGQLSNEVYSIDPINTGLILKSSPRELLRYCANSVTIATTTGGDFVLNSATPAEVIEVKLPVATGSNTISYGQFKIYNSASFLIPITNSNLISGTNTIVPASTLSPGVYRFELLISASTMPPLNETIKGQFIVK